MPPLRLFVGVAVGFLIFFPPNLVAYRVLLHVHPRRARLIRLIAAAGNAMWLLLPFVLGSRTGGVVRILRSILAPPWFTWLMFTLLYSGLVLALALLWLLVRRQRPIPFADFGRWPSTVCLTLLCSMGAIGCAQALVPLRIERVAVSIAELPPGASGYRIALISDLHVGLFTRRSRLDAISRAVAAERPDAVLVAGDFIDDDPAFVPKFLAGLEAIPAATPVIAVLGNHEIYGDPRDVIRRMRGSRVRLLVNEGLLLKPNLWLAGLSEFAAAERRGGFGAPELEPDLPRALAAKPPSAMPILLAHQPRAFALARRSRIPLTLAAHTHGGQFGLRPIGWSLAGVFLPYDMGLYTRDGVQLYVHTGTGHWVVPMRFGMPPVITVIELRGAKG